jgi:hypothetical protein
MLAIWRPSDPTSPVPCLPLKLPARTAVPPADGLSARTEKPAAQNDEIGAAQMEMINQPQAAPIGGFARPSVVRFRNGQ